MVVDNTIVGGGGDSTYHLSGKYARHCTVGFCLFPTVIITLQMAGLMFRKVE